MYKLKFNFSTGSRIVTFSQAQFNAFSTTAGGVLCDALDIGMVEVLSAPKLSSSCHT